MASAYLVASDMAGLLSTSAAGPTRGRTGGADAGGAGGGGGLKSVEGRRMGVTLELIDRAFIAGGTGRLPPSLVV